MGTAQQEILVTFTNIEAISLVVIFITACVIGYVTD